MFVVLLAGAAMSFLTILSCRRRFQGHLRLFWFLHAPLLLAFLLCAEAVVIPWLTETMGTTFSIEVTIFIFRALWWFVPAWLINLAVERFFWTPLEKRTGRAIPRIVRIFAAMLVYILALLGVTAFVFEQKVTSLLATSGVLAMIIGLAVQMNLSNIFSGIAINVERPFRMGDWIKIDDYEPGQVVGITWRTTRIETVDNNIVCIPNSVASDSTLINFSYPHEAYRAELSVHVDPGAKPEWVEKILFDAVLATEGVHQDPGPYGVVPRCAGMVGGICRAVLLRRLFGQR